jgi:hypothetical protein
MLHEWGRVTNVGYLCEGQKDRHYQEDEYIDESIILKWILVR